MIALGLANMIMTIIAIVIIKTAIRRGEAKHRATTRKAVRDVCRAMDSERTAAQDADAMRAQVLAALETPDQSRHLHIARNA